LISLLELAVPATAQATFGSSFRVSNSEQGAQLPQVGVDINGNAIYVWAHYDGTDPDGIDVEGKRTCCFRIEARTRTAGGVVGPVVQISGAGKNATQPAVAFDPAGDAYIAWVVDNVGSPDVVQTRRLSSTGVLSATQILSNATQNVAEPQVAVDPNGNAYFTWERQDGTTGCGVPGGCFRVQIRRRAANGTLGTVQTLSNAGQAAFGPQIVVDNAGNAVVSWTAFNFSSNKNEVQVRRRGAGGGLSALQILSSTTKNSNQSQIAVRPSNGDTVITWVEFSGTVDLIMGRARSASGTLSATLTLSASGQFSEEPQVAVDSNGNAIFIWERLDATSANCCWRIETRTRTAGGVLGATETHSAAGQTALAPQVGFDSSGNAVFVWGRFDGTNPSSFCCFLIQTRRRSASGTLSTIQTLSLGGQNAKEPQIAVDPNGNANYVWTRFDGKYNRVQGRRRTSAGSLQGLQTLSAVGPDGFTPDVAVDPNGNGVFAWVAFDGTKNSIQARSRSSTGVLGAIQTLSVAGQNATQPQVAVDSNGNAVFVWKRFDGSSGSCCDRIEARTRTASGTLGAVETLSDPGQNANAPQVALNGTGSAVFTWTRSDGTNTRVEARARSSVGTLSAVQLLSPAGQNAAGPQVGIDSTGNAVFDWTRSDGTNTRIEAIARSAAGTLSAVQLLSPVGQNASQPQLGVDSSGNAVFTWTRFDGTNNRIQARTRSSTGTLTAVKTLSLAGQNASQPQVAVNASGNAVFTWSRFDGTVFRVQVVARSAAGTLSAVQTLSAASDSSGLPQAAIDSNGNAVFVWRFDGADKRIQAKTRSAAGTLGALQLLSNATQNADLPQVAVNAAGTAFATWQRFDGKKSRVEGSRGP
jgi:hypothetical protein